MRRVTRGAGRRARWVFVALMAVLGTAETAAQTGRVTGFVRDAGGRPIKGATIVAENPEATPASFSATTDDKGRFGMIGLTAGLWTFRASAPGYEPATGSGRIQTIGANSPMEFRLVRAQVTGALAGPTTRALQAELARADALFDAGKYDEAIDAYGGILKISPTLDVINLQIGRAYRLKHDYDRAMAAFREVLAADPTNERAIVEIGLTQMDRGELDAAESTLTAAAEQHGAGREVFYALGEVKFAKGRGEEATAWYMRASEADPTWARPHLRLGVVAVNRGDSATAIQHFERVLALAPETPDATQARAFLERLRK
ncbi:MAG: tetratricopeptide repeat protein [Vicinamibacteraceae bacterium]|nr:tetratricopeptide repeat protein [Vicinamibacteraceae bacterium]